MSTKEKVKEKLTIAQRQQKILEYLKNSNPVIPIHQYFGDLVKFGVVSDTHIGSLYEHNNVLDLAYKCFKKEGIKNVYHAGDFCEGENMFRGQEYEIYAHGAGAQIKACVDKYPKIKGITTYFITGSHDLSFYKRAGIDVGESIQKEREDLVYLGREESDVIIKTKHGEIILRLVHPGKGTAYALSYHPQKYIESLSGGQKPNILLIGHYHKAEYLPCYRNVFTIQTGCIQGQTPFMKRQNLAAHIGFWIVELRISNSNGITGISRLKAEFFPYYEERIIKRKVKS